MLRPGDVIDLEGFGPARVELVNECRARVRPLARTQRTIMRPEGEDVTFDAPSRPLDISPSGVGVRVIERAPEPEQPKRVRVE